MFTQEQLDKIAFAARRTKNQGELAVLGYLWAKWENLFNETEWNIVKFCAEECKRQHSGEMSVYDMVNAWEYAADLDPNDFETPNQIDLSFIETIGKIVEPIDNAKGFRTIPIFVGNSWGMVEKAPWWRVTELLEMLLASYYEGILWERVDAAHKSLIGHTTISKSAEDQFYYEYENIHPFKDGNGRSGKVLYNYLCGTLNNPQMPPNYWGSSNP